MLEQLTLVSYDLRSMTWKDSARIQHNSVFHLVTQGKLIYVLDGKEYHLQKGDFLYIPHGVSRCGYPKPPYSHQKYVVRFSYSMQDDVLPILSEQRVVQTRTKRFQYLQQRLALCHEYWQEKDLYYTVLCRSIALEVLAIVNRDSRIESLNKKSAYLRKIRDYIHEHYQSPLTIDELAALVKINPTYLISQYKNHYGLPPIEYMHKLRIAKAEELLIMSDRSIEDIGYELGYCDGSYFYRVFKKVTGVAPSFYRKQH